MQHGDGETGGMAGGVTGERFAAFTRRGFLSSAAAFAAGIAVTLSGCFKASSGQGVTTTGVDILRERSLADGGVLPVRDQTAGGDIQPHDGFVTVSDAVPDVLQDIRYFGTYNFVGERIDGYEEPVAILSEQAAAALARANDEAISRGYRLKVFDCYRPQRAVEHFARWAEGDDERMREFFFPGVGKSELFERGYIARRSGHSRGSTVDLTLFDMAAGTDADMGGGFDLFDASSHPVLSAGVSEAQHGRRMLLRELMLEAGFDPSPNEWWHFTLRGEPFHDTYFDFPVARSSVGS